MPKSKTFQKCPREVKSARSAQGDAQAKLGACLLKAAQCLH